MPGVVFLAIIAALVIGVVIFVVLRPTGKGELVDDTPPEEKQPQMPPPAAASPAAREPAAPPAAREELPQPEPGQASARALPSASPPPAPSAPAPSAAPSATPASEAPAAAAEPAAVPPTPSVRPKSSKPPRSTKADLAALRKGLSSTRGGFIARLAQLFAGKKEIDPGLLNELQEVLITADIGVHTSERILARLREKLEKDELGDEDRVWAALREEARGILTQSADGIQVRRAPTVVLVVGVNGVGKTTTIGKLASRFKDEGKKVILAAGDTFRAAAVLQLEVWGRRVGCEVVKGRDRADPSSVIFDAIKRAQTEEVDVLLVDTAGRLHTKANLMEELKKVARTVEKALDRPVDDILLVLDSTTGQNAIRQAELFKEAIPVSGIALTKLDGTAKGGVILGIVDQHRLPVHFVGIGERVEDLRDFDAGTFVEALFTKPQDENASA